MARFSHRKADGINAWEETYFQIPKNSSAIDIIGQEKKWDEEANDIVGASRTIQEGITVV